MTKAEAMIADARQRALEREGARFKVRMSAELKKKAQACAESAGMELGEWVNAACLKMKSGAFNGVAWRPDTQEATRNGSEAVWVRAPRGLNAAQIRLAAACGVAVCEPLIREAFSCGMVEGIDYLVERCEEA
jgi:hypothetical protein